MHKVEGPVVFFSGARINNQGKIEEKSGQTGHKTVWHLSTGKWMPISKELSIVEQAVRDALKKLCDKLF